MTDDVWRLACDGCVPERVAGGDGSWLTCSAVVGVVPFMRRPCPRHVMLRCGGVGGGAALAASRG